MRIRLEFNEYETCTHNSDGNAMWLHLTTEQAKALRNAITASLRGEKRDKENQ